MPLYKKKRKRKLQKNMETNSTRQRFDSETPHRKGGSVEDQRAGRKQDLF